MSRIVASDCDWEMQQGGILRPIADLFQEILTGTSPPDVWFPFGEYRNWPSDRFTVVMLAYHGDVVVQNPIITFKRRYGNGDFDPLCEDEDPNNLPAGREPLTNEVFVKRRETAYRHGAYWRNAAETKVRDLYQSIVEEEARKLFHSSVRELIAESDVFGITFDEDDASFSKEFVVDEPSGMPASDAIGFQRTSQGYVPPSLDMGFRDVCSSEFSGNRKNKCTIKKG